MEAVLYDSSAHYQTVWQQKDGGKKGVDVVAIRMQATPPTAWLIEAKDFRSIRGEPKASNIAGLAAQVATKATDTIDGLAHAASNAADSEEKRFATTASATPGQRIVLHLEPYTGESTKLFPRDFSSKVLQELKRLVRPIDPNPLVLSIATTRHAKVPWSAA